MNLLGFIVSDLIEGKALEINCKNGDKITVTPLAEEGIAKYIAYEYRTLQQGQHKPDILPKRSFGTVVTLLAQAHKRLGFDAYHNGTTAFYANFAGELPDMQAIEMHLGIEFDEEAAPANPLTPHIKPILDSKRQGVIMDFDSGMPADPFAPPATPNDSGDDTEGSNG